MPLVLFLLVLRSCLFCSCCNFNACCDFVPILNPPMFKIPLHHVGIALIINVVKCSITWYKVCGIVIYVQTSRVQAITHLLHLHKPVGFHLSRLKQIRNRFSGNVFFQNALLLGVDLQKPGHGDTELMQCFIVPQLRV